MDFGRPLIAEASIASKSKIRYLPPVTVETAHGDTLEERTRNVKLDNEVVQAANDTAKSVFSVRAAGPTSNTDDNENDDDDDDDDEKNAWLLDASHYTDRITTSNSTIQAGDLVVIQESFDRLDFVYCQEGAIYNNRNGHFHHNDFINKLPFGSKLRSRNNEGYGFIYLLKPTPELWTRSLNHRTQVVHELDQSQIIFQLWLQPNGVAVESGTGSGAMSHALLRTIAPAGHLHTYEFSRHRSRVAAREFAQHSLGHLVTVHHKDVCYGMTEDDHDGSEEEGDGEGEAADGEVDSRKKGERINTESKKPPTTTTKTTTTPGFDLPDESVDAVFLDLPEPWVAVPHAAKVLRPDARIATYSPCVEQTQRTIEALERAGFHSIQTVEYRLKEFHVDEVEFESPPTAKRPKHEPHNVNNYMADKKSVNGKNGNDKANDDDEPSAQQEQKPDTLSPTTTNTSSRKTLVARPFATMRGHTAFLTFATKNPVAEEAADAAAASASKS